MHKIIRRLNAPQMIIMGFVLVIMGGAFLLSMPAASASGESVGFAGAFFTATSSVSVTGLVVFEMETAWSLFGKVVILLLIQIGGLGFMSIVTIILVFMGKRITLKERMLIQHSLNQNDLKGMVRLVRNVVVGTLFFEGATAVLLAVHFVLDGNSMLNAVGLGIFHAVSSLCNAGFDDIGSSNLSRYVCSPLINIVIMTNIIMGGLGYTVWIEFLRSFRKNKKFGAVVVYKRLSLHCKIVVEMTLALIIFGAVFFFAVEYNNPLTIGGLPAHGKILASLFQSVTARTTGFYTIDQENFLITSQFMTILFMFIGGSPASTSGGVKTVTLAVILLSVISVIRGKNNITAHGRSIPFSILQKSLAVVMLNLGIIIVATMILSITERQHYGPMFLEILFETVSATSTAGLSLGMTQQLSNIGRFVICACMLIGRIGPITVAYSLTFKQSGDDGAVHYPEEKLLIG